MPVSGETFDELSGLLALNIPENKAPRDWSILISSEIHVDQWRPNLSESSGLHRYGSMECSSVLLWCAAEARPPACNFRIPHAALPGALHRRAGEGGREFIT